MTDFFFRRNDIFPVDTSVGAYDGLDVIAPEGRPPPAGLVDTATMTSEGLTFTGLAESGRYWAVAEVDSAYRWMGFWTAPSQEIAVGPEGPDGPQGPAGLDGGLVFNVQNPDYGATGDGTTDDTGAIQDTIDAAEAAGGGVVYFPRGDYLLTDTLLVPSFVSLEGCALPYRAIEYGIDPGVVVSQLVCGGSADFAMIRNADTTNGNAMIAIRKLRLHLAGATSDDALAIHFSMVRRSVLEELYIRGADTPSRVGLVFDNSTEVVYVSKVGLEGTGITAQNANAVDLDRCEVGAAGIEYNTCIFMGIRNSIIYQDASATGDDTPIWKHGIRLVYCVENVIENNEIRAYRRDGISLLSSDHCVVKNNFCVENSRSVPGSWGGIVLDVNDTTTPCEYNLIEGNHCWDRGANTQQHGIRLANYNRISTNVTQFNIIRNNNFAGNLGAGIFLDTDYELGSNTIENNKTRDEAQDVIDVTQYGATGDGSTDDTAAVQAAINACGEAGGGTVHFPIGDYRIATSRSSYGTVYALYVGYDSVHLRGEGADSRLIFDIGTGTGYYGFHIGGGVKYALDIDDLGEEQQAGFWQGLYVLSGYDLTGSTDKGSLTVTLDTSAEASNFTVGGYVAIRTGQTIAPGSPPAQPDAEINVVVSANAGTGVIELEVPTAKPYQQENFISGSTGISEVGGGGSAALYQACPIPDNRIMQDFKMSDMGVESDGDYIFIGGNMDGMTLDNLDVKCTGGKSLDGSGIMRYKRIMNCRVTHENLTQADAWVFGSDTTSSDHLWVDNTVTADSGDPGFHIHEGSARLTAARNRIYRAEHDGSHHQISIRGRAYDIVIQDNHFHTGTAAAFSNTVYIDDYCTGGGRIQGNHYSGEHPIQVGCLGGPSWVVDERSPAFEQSSTLQPDPSRNLIWADSTAGNIALQLAPFANYQATVQTVKNIGSANLVQVQPNYGVETIDGVPGKYLAPDAWITYTADATEFKIIGQGGTVTNVA